MAGDVTQTPPPPDGFVLDGAAPPAGAAGMPPPPDGFQMDAPPPAPNVQGANRTFSHVLGDALTSAKAGMDQAATAAGNVTGVKAGTMADAEQTTRDLGTVYGPVEAALNAGTGLAFGFPAYIGGALGGLADKYLMGMDVDPKQMAETMQKVFTYQPMTDAGRRLSGNLALPLTAMTNSASSAGHGAADVAMRLGASDDTAAALGAVTDATLQMLPGVLLGELGRKMGGQVIGNDDMQNVAKVVAGEDAKPEQVQAVESSLRATYEKTGIGPYTVLDEAQRNPDLHADLMDPNVEIPRALEPYQERPAPQPEPAPGDGMPVLDTTPQEVADSGAQGFVDEVRDRAPDVNDPTVFDRPEPQTLEAAGLKDEAADRVDAALAARAQSIDPEAFDKAAADHVNDDGAFMDAVKGIIRDAEDQNPEAGPSGELDQSAGAESQAAGEPAAAESDAGGNQGADGELYAGNTVELHAGLNPASAFKGFADDYSPYVGVEKPEVKGGKVLAGNANGYRPSPLGDALRKVFAPAARGELAEKQAGIMRENFGKMARQQELALEKLKGIAADFDKMPVEENVKFIDAMENGREIGNAKLDRYAGELRQLLDAKRDEVRELGTGKLENFDENYFPHIWKDPEAGAALFRRRPLEGSKSFLKSRTIPTTVDGMRWRAYDAEGNFFKSFDTEAEAKMAAGTDGRVGEPLQPITTNPVELALLKAREMDRYIYGQKIFAEMKDTGLARFVAFGGKVPEGWTKINDAIARAMHPSDTGGMILRGEYYAPDEAATLINNHLSPGLQGNAFFDAWRGIGTALNSAQLGLSLFHVGFTTMDSMISRVALGVKQIARGDVGEGAANVAIGASPAQPFLNIVKGDRLLRAYLGNLDSPEMAPIVDAIQTAGGRVKMDDFYRNTTVNAFKQALRNGDKMSAAKAFLPTVLDRVSAPIFEWLVPRQKLGVFFDMAKDWVEKNPDASVEVKRAELGKLWDSVDNRMGQLVYDNVFWNRALKDGLMASVRSVGWNLGTFRELGGGVLDIKDIARGKPMSDRTAYLVALPAVAATYGAILNYANTGEAPRDLKDCFFPRTGRMRPDGTEDRVSLPTYMKDVYSYGEDIRNFAKYGTDPTQTLKNKMSPLIATTSEMLNNQDYFGGAIRNPADPVVKQIADEALFIARQVEPFSVSNYQQQAKTRGEEPTIGGYLTAPSMIGIAPAPGYIVQNDEQKESSQISRLRDPLMKKYRQEIRAGRDPDEVIPAMVRSGLTRAEIRSVVRSAGRTGPYRLRSFADDSDQP